MVTKTNKKKSSDTIEILLPENLTAYLTPISIFLSSLIISATIFFTLGNRGIANNTNADIRGAKSGDITAQDTEEIQPTEEVPTGPAFPAIREYKTFTEYDSDVCKEDGKPLVFLFTTTWCPHCTWIKDTFDDWVDDNDDKIKAYHYEIDTNDDTLTKEVETSVPAEHMKVYEDFNPRGSIPTFVFGCKYARVGNGYEAQDDLKQEEETFDEILKEIL